MNALIAGDLAVDLHARHDENARLRGKILQIIVSMVGDSDKIIARGTVFAQQHLGHIASVRARGVGVQPALEHRVSLVDKSLLTYHFSDRPFVSTNRCLPYFILDRVLRASSRCDKFGNFLVRGRREESFRKHQKLNPRYEQRERETPWKA